MTRSERIKHLRNNPLEINTIEELYDVVNGMGETNPKRKFIQDIAFANIEQKASQKGILLTVFATLAGSSVTAVIISYYFLSSVCA